MKKRFLGVVVAILVVVLFTFSACVPQDNSDYDKQIENLQKQIAELQQILDELQQAMADIKDNETQAIVYNEAGGFYEREVDDMVDCSLFHYHVAQSWIGNPITLNHPNADAIFTCTVDRGISSTPDERTFSIKSGEGFWWYPIDADSRSGAMVDIVLRIDGNIIGYAVVEIYPLDEVGHEHAARTLISALFPQIEGELQPITLEQVQAAINEVK